MTTWPRNSRSFTQRRDLKIFESSFATEDACRFRTNNLPSVCDQALSLRRGHEAEADWIKYRNVVVTRQLSGDKTLLTEGRIFTDPEGLRNQTFYHYTEKALDNVRKSFEAEGAQAPGKD